MIRMGFDLERNVTDIIVDWIDQPRMRTLLTKRYRPDLELKTKR